MAFRRFHFPERRIGAIVLNKYANVDFTNTRLSAH